MLLEDNPMSSLVIMDFDGVIIDTEYVWYQIFVEWFKKNFDYTLTEEEFMMSIGADAHILFNYLREKKNINVDLVSFRKETQNLFIEKSKNLPLIDGVENFIKQVKSDGWKLSLATSATKEKPLYHLKRLKLLDYFDYLVTADLVENIKPEPDLFLKAIDLAGVDKSDAVIIEDSKNGLIAGIKAGIDVIICPNRLTKDDDFTGCLNIVDSLDKIEL